MQSKLKHTSRRLLARRQALVHYLRRKSAESPKFKAAGRVERATDQSHDDKKKSHQ